MALKDLFASIKMLKDFSNNFKILLENATDFNDFVTLIAEIDYRPFFDVANHYDAYIKFQKKLSPLEHRKLQKALDNLIPKDITKNQLPFETYAIEIVQRLPRYALLIGALIKVTEGDVAQETHLNLLKQALDKTKNSIQTMNDAVRQSIMLHDSSHTGDKTT